MLLSFIIQEIKMGSKRIEPFTVYQPAEYIYHLSYINIKKIEELGYF